MRNEADLEIFTFIESKYNTIIQLNTEDCHQQQSLLNESDFLIFCYASCDGRTLLCIFGARQHSLCLYLDLDLDLFLSRDLDLDFLLDLSRDLDLSRLFRDLDLDLLLLLSLFESFSFSGSA